jgi:hypothetical protein
MKFEHLVQVNDTHNPLIYQLTRDQLWQGLVFRAEEPLTFVLGLDGFTILSWSDNAMKRELRFGQTLIVDQVTFVPPEKVHYAIHPGSEYPEGSLTMEIEEPTPGDLFVRFTYEIMPSGEECEDGIQYDAFKKQAYCEADIDTIRRIRELAENGQFDHPSTIL